MRTVLSSARRVRPLRPASQDLPDDGMAVLVQPMLTSAVGGVMFGADPIEGRTDRLLVNVLRGGPDHLVDGSTRGARSRSRRLPSDPPPGGGRPVPDGATRQLFESGEGP
ncbi:PEP/pyruvate-binding domain-containing protein [Streptomyces nigra]|uniref:PEP/pyruvate-binding domain-containing protein n=1 Tax=Streptomyces TaxID=1883 RepID=UPI0006E31916|nr:PEP/pyruvate-binding domain-containing protein [Streptomyces sp. JHA19]